MKKTKEKKAPKPSSLDRLANETARDWAHQHSVVIHSHMRVLRFEAEELDKAILGIAAALDQHKERRRKVEATLRGMMAVVEKR